MGNITGIPVTYSGTLTWEFRNSRDGIPCERQADDKDRRVADDDITSESHKSIAQTNRTKQDDITSKNGNDERHFQMLQSNSGAYGGPETCQSNRNMSKSKG